MKSLVLYLVILPNVLGSLDVKVSEDGGYSIVVDNKTWLKNAPTFFNKDGRRLSADDNGGLTLMTTCRKKDTSGTFKSTTTFEYSTDSNADTEFATSITVSATGMYAIFEQRYLALTHNTSVTGYDTTVAGFPRFKVADAEEPLGFLSFGGHHFASSELTTGRFTNETDNINGGMKGGPLSLFNENGQAIFIVPLDNYMAASMWHENKPGGSLAWGIMGGVNDIPATFVHRVGIFYGKTINEAVTAYGSLQDPSILKERRRLAESDVALRYLGYWTNNGGYYYYKTEPNKTYEETMIDVKLYADQEGIPYGYLEFDSWWYPKDPDTDGVTSWTPMDSVFPNGFPYLSNVTGLKFSLHNRFWSAKTPYARQNNGSYNWVVEDRLSLPNDTEFWRDIFREGKKWGLIVYEQDWLKVQVLELDALQTSLTLGRDWLTHMGSAAAEFNLTIQYCGPMSRHALQAQWIPTVTQARVSPDLASLKGQWKIGTTSMFASALGIMPFKDTFWTTHVQPGNPYNRTSEHHALQTAISSLSRGPVGPGDMIGGTNKTLLMRCCNNDGLLLRPSKPAIPINKQMVMKAFGNDIGEIYTTTSVVTTNGEDFEYGILLAADIKGNFTVTFTDLMFTQIESGVFFPYTNVSDWRYFDRTSEIDLTGCTQEDFCIYYFSPFLANTTVQAVFGDVTKWVPMSSDRVLEITSGSTDTMITLSGAKNETVPIYYLVGDTLKMVECSTQDSNCVLKSND